jgi:hypothetical protein
MDSKRAIDKVIGQHRKWIRDIAPEVYEETLEWLAMGLQDRSLVSLSQIAGSLLGVASWHGVKGTLAVYDGDQRGWGEIHVSCQCRLWSATLDAIAFRRLAATPKLTLHVPRVACLLCYAIACELHTWRKLFAALLRDMSSDPGMVGKDYWTERIFEPFVLELCEIEETGSSSVAGRGDDNNVYRRVLACWTDEEQLARSLTAICDYHCARIEDDGDWDPEFDESPFDLVPWEFLAIRKVREGLGLSTPHITHALLNSPLVHVRRDIDHRDELLAKVEEHCTQLCGPIQNAISAIP